MNKRRLSMGILGAGFSFLGSLVACADSNEASFEPTPEAGVAIPPEADAGVDAKPPPETDRDAAPRRCSNDNFCHTQLPTGQVLRGVWGDGTGTVWAVSDSGSILRWDGSAWTVHTANAGSAYFSVWGSSPTDVWVGGSTGLLHGTGASPATLVFAPVEAPGDATIPIVAIWGSGPDDIWAVGAWQTPVIAYPQETKGRVLHYLSGTWTLDETFPADAAYTRVWGTPSSGVWIGGNSFIFPDEFSQVPVLALYRRAPGSTSFAAENLPADPTTGSVAASLDGANASSDTTTWVFAHFVSGLGTWHATTADGGQTISWTYEPRPIGYTLNAVWAASDTDTWAGGEYGRLNSWDGSTWKQAALSTTQFPEVSQFYGIWGTSQNDLWVVGDNIALHKLPKSP